MYYIPQITPNDCLFTAFKILLANIKNDERYLYLPENEKRGPYSLFEIIEKGKQYGVELLGFEADDKKELANFNELPLILNIKRNEHGLHSVYVYKVTKHHVYFLDSDIGKQKLKFDKFIEIWDGTGLMIKSNSEPIEELNIVSVKAKRNIFGKLFQVLSGICFIVGIYIIDDEIGVLLPALIIIVGIIFEVITKVIQLKDMRRFDFDSMHLLENAKTKNYVEFLPRREKLKQIIFSAKNNYLFYLLCCLFVIFVELLNTPYSIACIFMPIALAIVQTLIVAPIEKKKNFEVECLEVKFQREKTSSSACKTLREIEDGSYKYSYYVLCKTALGLLLLFLAASLTLKLLDAFNLINLFFLLFSEIFLYQSLLPIFSFESRKAEEKLNYMRFINLLQ